MTVSAVGLACGVFGAAYWATGWLARHGSAFYLLDHPSSRSLHATPTPRGGGIAIVGSVLGGLALVEAAGRVGVPGIGARERAAAVSAWVVVAVLLIGAVSLWDDRRGVPPAVRLALHAVAAACIVWGAGWRVRAIPLPRLGELGLGWGAIPFTILLLIWMANLYNFMDGLDGLAGGMSVSGFGFLGYLAWSAARTDLAMVALLVAAAAAGFLVHNLPPARIFMGDVGSVPLGFLAGTIAVAGVHHGLFDIWAPTLIFAPFVVDATVTLLRRVTRRERVWMPHRSHYYQRLAVAGWGHRKTMLAEYALMLACGISALVYASAGDPLVRAAILLAWAAVWAALAWSVLTLETRQTLREASGR